MINSKLLLHAAASSLGAAAYISLVSWIMVNGERFFGPMKGDFRGPMIFLMLFVLSATIVGLIILGRPLYLFLSGSKKEAITLLLLTVGGLFVLTVIGFVLLIAT